MRTQETGTLVGDCSIRAAVMTSNLPPAESDDFSSGNRQSLPQRRQGVPAAVLAARLEHQLYSADLLTRAGDPAAAMAYIERAQEILAQLREAMK